MSEYVVAGEDKDCVGITVEVTRHIRVGTRCRINSSYGWAGITAGEILVTGLIQPNAGKHDELLFDYTHCGSEFIEGIMDEPFIQFRYSHGEEYDTIYDDGYYYLPLDIFIGHTSTSL